MLGYTVPYRRRTYRDMFTTAAYFSDTCIREGSLVTGDFPSSREATALSPAATRSEAVSQRDNAIHALLAAHSEGQRERAPRLTFLKFAATMDES